MTHDEAIEAAARVEAAEVYRDRIGLGPDHPLRATETEKDLARALLTLDERAKAMEAEMARRRRICVGVRDEMFAQRDAHMWSLAEKLNYGVDEVQDAALDQRGAGGE